MLLLLTALQSVSFSSRLVAPPRLINLADAQNTPVVRVPGFLQPDEIEALSAAAAQVAASAGEQDIHKRQGAPEGSWSTVFFNHQLVELLPEIHERLFAAAREADAEHWRLLDDERHELAMRCVEYHSVTKGGGIPMDKHHDFGSLLTLDVMLSEPDVDYEGGEFGTLEADGSLQRHTFARGDLLIFASHKYHCVQPVTSGRRKVLVCEVWEGLPRRCARRCNTPWGACECQFAPPPAMYTSREALTKIAPCLRLMSKSDADLVALDAELASRGPEAAEERQMVGSHALWMRRQTLDKARKAQGAAR